MQTLLALAQKDRFKGKRRFFGATIGLCEPTPRGGGCSLWFSETPSERAEESSVYVGSVAYFEVSWIKNQSASARSQVSRAQRKGLRFDLRRSGESCPYEDMRGLFETWRKDKLFLVGYLLQLPLMAPILTYDCIFLWRGDRLVGFAPLIVHGNFVFIENFYRHNSLPNGSLPFLVQKTIEAYQKPITFGLSPNISFLPKTAQVLLSLVYNFSGLAKARQNLRPSRETSIFLHYPGNWSRLSLSLYLTLLLLND